MCYATDVEGNYEYFKRTIEESEGLKIVAVSTAGVIDLELLPGWSYVFGGDSVDKGGAIGGSQRVVQTLIKFKRKYPKRVTIILGNRDLNKMRLTSELAPDQMSALDTVPGPYWVPEGKRVSPKDYLRQSLAKARSVPAADISDADIAAANTVANRIRWMMKDTMGADGEFERRQSELTEINQARGRGAATEEETAQNFLASVKKGGFMRELLELGELAKVIGDTLYVHGGLIKGEGSFRGGETCAYGFVPSQPEKRITATAAWTRALNAWLQSEVAAWIAQPLWQVDATGGYAEAYSQGRRGGHGAMDYVVPDSLPSVVLGRHLDKAGMPKAMPAYVEEQLAANGIRRLVIGHTPHGNCPTVIKSTRPAEDGAAVDVIMADTSYSNMKAPDNRGGAVSEVRVHNDGSTRVRGVLEDGTAVDYSVQPAGLVGLVTREEKPFMIKAKLPATREYLLCNVAGFTNTYERLSQASCLERLGRKGASTSDDPLPMSPPPAAFLSYRAQTLLSCGAVGAIVTGGLVALTRR